MKVLVEIPEEDDMSLLNIEEIQRQAAEEREKPKKDSKPKEPRKRKTPDLTLSEEAEKPPKRHCTKKSASQQLNKAVLQKPKKPTKGWKSGQLKYDQDQVVGLEKGQTAGFVFTNLICC